MLLSLIGGMFIGAGIFASCFAMHLYCEAKMRDADE